MQYTAAAAAHTRCTAADAWHGVFSPLFAVCPGDLNVRKHKYAHTLSVAFI
jgi:hypothetical protein